MNKRVLIVDDSRLIRKAVRNLLEECLELEILGEAANGAEALALANKSAPDLVILDLSMPVMNGDDAAKKLKDMLPSTRIILFSQYASEASQVWSLPVDAVVAKADTNALLETVQLLIFPR